MPETCQFWACVNCGDRGIIENHQQEQIEQMLNSRGCFRCRSKQVIMGSERVVTETWAMLRAIRKAEIWNMRHHLLKLLCRDDFDSAWAD